MDTNPIVPLYTEKTPENRIWRFFSDSAHKWRWERLAFNGTVLEHSKSGYSQYESCMANASESGYVFLPSSSTKPEDRSPRKKRSYFKFQTKAQKQVSKVVMGGQKQKEDTPIAAALDASGSIDSQ